MERIPMSHAGMIIGIPMLEVTRIELGYPEADF
jgi:hypothetical protein